MASSAHYNPNTQESPAPPHRNHHQPGSSTNCQSAASCANHSRPNVCNNNPCNNKNIPNNNFQGDIYYTSPQNAPGSQRRSYPCNRCRHRVHRANDHDAKNSLQSHVQETRHNRNQHGVPRPTLAEVTPMVITIKASRSTRLMLRHSPVAQMLIDVALWVYDSRLAWWLIPIPLLCHRI